MVKTTAAKEHVRDIEWTISVMKEYGRCIVGNLECNDSILDQIFICLLQFVVFLINALSSDGGSEVYSPCKIVTGMKSDFNSTARQD